MKLFGRRSPKNPFLARCDKSTRSTQRIKNQRINLPTKNHANSETPQMGTPITNARHWESFAITAEIKDISHAYADREKITNAKYETSPEKSQRQLEENPTNQTSIHRIERINRITDKNKYLTTTEKVNGIEKECIVDTGSPISIMPADENIMKRTEIQKVKHRYQDVNKNEVKFRGKIPADIEYENNKQKMQI